MHTSAVVRHGVCLPTRGWPPEQMYPIMVRVSLVTGLTVPLCAHPASFSTPGLKPRIAADPLAAVWPGRPRWYCSWATSGVAGLSWRLLLYSLCCFRHYLWLEETTLPLSRGKLLYFVEYLNCPLGLRGEGLAYSASLDFEVVFWTSLFYFNTFVVTMFNCLFWH